MHEFEVKFEGHIRVHIETHIEPNREPDREPINHGREAENDPRSEKMSPKKIKI